MWSKSTVLIQIVQFICRPLKGADNKSLLNSQKGQAFVETILLMIISIILILGILFQFNDAFRRFTSSYFGSYLSCLLEAGELPGAGGLCESSYEPFSLANGRPLVDPAGGGSGSTGGTGGSGRSGGSDNGSGRDGSSFDRDSGRSSSGSNNRGSGSSNSANSNTALDEASRSSSSSSIPVGSSFNNSKFKGSESTSASRLRSQGGDEETIELTDSEKKALSGKRGLGALSASATSTRTSEFDQAQGRLRYIPMNKEEKESTIINKEKIELSDTDRKQLGGKRFAASVGKKKSDDEAPDVGMSLPNFLRYLLIAAIAIAVVLFLGGQAMALKKGQEKG